MYEIKLKHTKKIPLNDAAMPKKTPKRFYWIAGLIILLVMTLSTASVWAQEGGGVQKLSGSIDTGDVMFYRLSDLQAGQILFVYAAATSGDLDPLVAILDEDADLEALRTGARNEVRENVSAGHEPITAVERAADTYFLAWNDDIEPEHDAALSFVVTSDNDYWLVIGSSIAHDTSGAYRVLVGLDAPEVLTGRAQETGATIAVLDKEASHIGSGVQEVTGAFSEARQSASYRINVLSPGDTLYVHAQTSSKELKPQLELQDFSGKPLAFGNFTGQEAEATIEYNFVNGGDGYILYISPAKDGAESISGDYRLLAGVDAPEVLSGSAEVRGRPVLQFPTNVQIGIKLQQITGIDQKSENFGAVTALQFVWDDSKLAFNPDDCRCQHKVFTVSEFTKYVADRDTHWPSFSLFNQQGNRWSQNQVIVVAASGRAKYFERFTTTFQAPDFNFQQFPFDSQQFYIRVDSLLSERFLTYSDLPGFSEIGDQLGEEEWYVTDWNTEITSVQESTNNINSRFSLGYVAKRHLSFYIFRFFIPLLLIITVTWITFFLKDFGRRIEATSANLLLFIAYNFTIGDDLPRLGYVTFMDVLLMGSFFISVIIVIYNVALKRLEVAGKRDLTERIDNYMIWLYPLSFVLSGAAIWFYFF